MAEAKKAVSREQFMAAQSRKYGAGSIGLLSAANHAEITHWTSTGIYGLDDAMAWGIPGKRVVEMFGPESSGKTTVLRSTLMENARRGGLNFLADPEGTFDMDRYVQSGGKAEDVVMFYPSSHEQFYEWAMDISSWAKGQTSVPKNACVILAVDTLTMLVPNAVLKAEADDIVVGAAARVNSQNLPKLDQNLGTNTALILLSQVRDKIGSMAWSQEGNIDTPGGKIVKHVCSCRLLFNKEGQIDNGGKGDNREIVGMKTAAKVVKNKVGPPLRKAKFRIMFDERAVDNVDHCLETFVSRGLVKKGTSGVFTAKDVNFKRSEFHNFLKTHPKWMRWALDQSFDLYHEDIDIARYAGLKVADINDSE